MCWRGSSSIFTRLMKLTTVSEMQSSARAKWSNPSVSFFAGNGDPTEKMMNVALSVALERTGRAVIKLKKAAAVADQNRTPAEKGQ